MQVQAYPDSLHAIRSGIGGAREGVGNELLVVRDAEGSPCPLDREERNLFLSMITRRKDSGNYRVVGFIAKNYCVFIRLPISVV